MLRSGEQGPGHAAARGTYSLLTRSAALLEPSTNESGAVARGNCARARARLSKVRPECRARNVTLTTQETCSRACSTKRLAARTHAHGALAHRKAFRDELW